MGSVVDVERVRTAAERIACASLPAYIVRQTLAPQNTVACRRAVLSRALLLTEAMAPEACSASQEAADRLGVEDTVELYQSNESNFDSARLVLYGKPLGVEFLGGYLGSLDHGGLLAVIGHEIGHALAHMTNPQYAWAWLGNHVVAAPDKRKYTMAAEVTADRFGLLACRDLDAVLRLEMQTVAGRSAHALRLDTRAYLDGCRRIAGEVLEQRGVAYGTSHPEHYVRAYAQWLFSETDLYASITGAGPASRSIEEVDAEIGRLLGLPETATGPVRFNIPVPPAVTATSPLGGALVAMKPDVLTDGARRGIEGTARALERVGEAVAPAVRNVFATLRSRMGAPATTPPAPTLTDDERAMLARLEELARKKG